MTFVSKGHEYSFAGNKLSLFQEQAARRAVAKIVKKLLIIY
jgi:hypothetical protein